MIAENSRQYCAIAGESSRKAAPDRPFAGRGGRRQGDEAWDQDGAKTTIA